jgi:hypothetical protein
MNARIAPSAEKRFVSSYSACIERRKHYVFMRPTAPKLMPSSKQTPRWSQRMSKKLHLHLDADTSSKALHSALLACGHDVTRSPTEWMPLDASDEQQFVSYAFC